MEQLQLYCLSFLKKCYDRYFKMSRQEVAPTVYCLLQRCQPTTAEVKRSFSTRNKLLAKDKNFLPKNVKRNMCVQYDLSTN